MHFFLLAHCEMLVKFWKKYVQRFDPVLKRWDAMPPMLVPRGNSAAVTIGVEDRIVVCGGNDGVQVLNVVQGAVSIRCRP